MATGPVYRTHHETEENESFLHSLVGGKKKRKKKKVREKSIARNSVGK